MIACFGEPLICFTGASLLDSPTVAIGEGGAEFNVAVHLARLGLDVTYVGAVGDDVLGRRIEARLRREGVDVSALHRDPAGRTGVYVKDAANRDVVYLRAGSAATRYTPPRGAFDGVRHVHLTGITAALSDTCLDVLHRLVARPRAFTVSFDVNYRPKLWDVDDAALCLAHLTGQADTVFVGRDEAELLWGTATADDLRSVLSGAAELVVRDDAREATAWAGDERVAVAPVPVEVVEPVGAGDAFAAGYLYVRLRGGKPAEALGAGHRLAREALRATDDLGVPVAPHELEGDR